MLNDVRPLPSVLAWRSASGAVEKSPQVIISGVDGFVNGTYLGECREDGPPIFVRRVTESSYRWLYFDEEGRWRVALQRQKDLRLAGTVGFLRSGPVAPGTLPASASDWEVYFSTDASSGWKECTSCMVCGAVHEWDWPDIVLTLHHKSHSDDGIIALTCTNVGGVEVAHLEVELAKDQLATVRTALSERLQFPKKKVKLVLPDGLLLSEDRSTSLLKDILFPSGSARTGLSPAPARLPPMHMAVEMPEQCSATQHEATNHGPGRPVEDG
jgi:hypothetical protein